jgi:triosephosphate isomerase
MRAPIVVVNFKVYETSSINALRVAKAIEKVSDEYGIKVIIAVPATMIATISSQVSLPVFAQHVDGDPVGPHTGSIIPELIKDAGASGTLINHSERRMRLDHIADVLERLRLVNLESILCVDRKELVAPAALMSPDAVLVEPPELIGSGNSVSRARPEVITESIKLVKSNPNVSLIVGAGITNYDDVSKAFQLGADGVGAASAVMKSPSPEKVVGEFLRAVRDQGSRP